MIKKIIFLILFLGQSSFAGLENINVPAELIGSDLTFREYRPSELSSYIFSRLKKYGKAGFCSAHYWKTSYRTCCNNLKDYTYSIESFKNVQKYKNTKNKKYLENLSLMDDLHIKRLAEVIADSIDISSKVVGVDSSILLGLIEHESLFQRTVQYSGGTGLTQFVESGIRENLEQFGIRSSYATPDQISAWRKLYDKMYQEVSKFDHRFPSFKTFENLTTMTKANQYKWVKETLLNSPYFATFFGAVHLKVKLALACGKGGSSCVSNALMARGNQKSALESILGNYKKGLFHYNGNNIKKQARACKYLNNKVVTIQTCYPYQIFSKRQGFLSSLNKKSDSQSAQKTLIDEIIFPVLNSNFGINKESVGRLNLHTKLKESDEKYEFLKKTCRANKNHYLSSQILNSTREVLETKFLLSTINCKDLSIKDVEISVTYDLSRMVLKKLKVYNFKNYEQEQPECIEDKAYGSEVKRKSWDILNLVNTIDDKVEGIHNRGGFSLENFNSPDLQCIEEFKIKATFDKILRKRNGKLGKLEYEIYFHPIYNSIIEIKLK